MATYPQTQADYVAALDDEDFLAGGHRTNFPLSLIAVLAFIDYSKLTADELVILAAQVTADAASAAAGSGTEASVANIRAAADLAHYISMRRAVAAQAPVALTDAASIAWDMATGINFKVVIGAADRALANPTNQIIGKNGFINVHQDATGGRSITTWGSNFIWIGPEASWPSTPNARTKIAYFVTASGEVELAFAGNSA
ncbi:hypothetical protein [Mesorhizobium sp. A556]